MTNHGDDCYFYYYSTCTKGDSCPFRHCEAAMGNETVCNQWQEGGCFRMVCKFRHMEIQKNRKEIPCYWENQPAGCQKAHCVFYHEKQRFIEGILVPPSKGPKTEEPQHEEPAPTPAPLPAAANPQLRGVIKAETQETVPSPTHPPVVINPADDDEDEDDQFSEEGEEGKFGPGGPRLISPRKLSGASIPPLNLGVSTLEEIRLRKSLKASMKRAGYPVQSADVSSLKTNRANRETIQSHCHPGAFQDREDQVDFGEIERNKNNILNRLGKRTLSKDSSVAGHPPLKRSLADRLGKVVEDEEQPDPILRNGFKPMKERIGFHAEAPLWPVQIPEAMSEPSDAPQQIRIKTLEEIRLEKASKSQNRSKSVASPATGSTTTKTTSTRNPKAAKSPIVVKDSSAAQMKRFSSSVGAKKKQQAEEERTDHASPGRVSQDPQRPTAQAQGPPDGPSPPETHLRVKTLEEIRREKAARMQARHAKDAEDAKIPMEEAGEDTANKPLRTDRPQVPSTRDSSSPSSGIPTKKNTEAKEKLVSSTGAEVYAGSSNGVKVKTFEEIMREKRLRKQEMEEQASCSPCPSPGRPDTDSHKQTPVPSLKKTLATKSQEGPPTAKSPSSSILLSLEGLPTAQSPPVRKRASLKSRGVSPSANGPSTVSSAPPSTSPPHPSPLQVNNNNNALGMNHSSAVAEMKQTPKMGSQGKSPGRSSEIKVRPKLNVRPSVMKPGVPVKPGHKRALAVRPLNSTATGPEGPPCSRRAISPTHEETRPRSAASQSPASGPAKEDPHTPPRFENLPVDNVPNITEAPDASASRDACMVPQSPTVKTSSQLRPRRSSVVASRVSTSSSAVDDFDELMNEFTDDHLGEDMDPGMGEDDLLQELSQMIDS